MPDKKTGMTDAYEASSRENSELRSMPSTFPEPAAAENTNEVVMSSKNTSVSQEEIRFLLKDFPCTQMADEQEEIYEQPFAPHATAPQRQIKRESLAKQIRRLFSDSMQHRL